MLNWIVLNRADYLYKSEFGVKYPTKVDMPQKPNQPTALNRFDRSHKLLDFIRQNKTKDWKRPWRNEVDQLVIYFPFFIHMFMKMFELILRMGYRNSTIVRKKVEQFLFHYLYSMD